MRFLFCNIAWMSYYKGNVEGNDEPKGGGSYVLETKDAHEKYNFQALDFEFSDDSFAAGKYCMGFVETKSTNGADANQLNIEKIIDCEACKKEAFVDDVTVVYCARYPYTDKPETLVVGWYKNARVYRNYERQDFLDENGELVEYQLFNAFAKKEDCVLLPTGVRRRGNTWVVPRKKGKTVTYGFGQSNVWFANDSENELLSAFLKRLEEQITNYDGENWIDKYPE